MCIFNSFNELVQNNENNNSESKKTVTVPPYLHVIFILFVILLFSVSGHTNLWEIWGKLVNDWASAKKKPTFVKVCY